jgi:RHS repeat-associated protein
MGLFWLHLHPCVALTLVVTHSDSFRSYTAGDVLRVAIESGTVKYYRNSTLLHTSTVTVVNYPLLVDTSLYTPGAWIKYAYVCRTTQISTTTTLYIGGLYEEELNGTSSPPYISYYSFGGKLVGMRRANQASGNGQYRIAGDHLGSSTLVLDTSSPPQVVSRQYHKPYGEVAWQGGGTPMQGITAIGYTGQRLETDSGLMFYNARFYDTFLAHFVSADTIAPDPRDPKTRNRFSYVLNNPIKYTDPSGNCVANSAQERQRCREAVEDLSALGVDVDEGCEADAGGGACRQFTFAELELIIESIRDLMKAANWDVADFRRQMGTDNGNHIKLRNRDFNGGATIPLGGIPNETLYGQSGGSTGEKLWQLDMYALRQGERNDRLNMKSYIVHELAHVWDVASSGRNSAFVSQNGWRDEKLPSQYAYNKMAQADRGEISRDDAIAELFAEVVAAQVYPNARRFRDFTAEYNNSDRNTGFRSGRINALRTLYR